MTKTPFILAIDGPAGAGKSTVARRVASELGFTYLDTGAMYRAVAWKLSTCCVVEELSAVSIAETCEIGLSTLDENLRQMVTIDGIDVTNLIRTPAISQLTSMVSAFAGVRTAIVAQQRVLGRSAGQGVVLEGRDIGTVVFPNANLKLFLTASPAERARRRYDELKVKGEAISFEEVLADQLQRDERDSQRVDSPLKPAADAAMLLTDDLTIGEVVNLIITMCRKKMDAIL